MLNPKVRLLILHVSGWIVFFILPFVFIPVPQFLFNNNNLPHLFKEMIFTNLMLVAGFYVLYAYVIPGYYFNRRYLTFALYVLAVFLCFSFLIYLISPGKPPPFPLKGPHHPPPFPKMGIALLRMVMLFIIAMGLQVYQRWQLTEKERKNLELSLLKTQINPHFLFNTLNGIYALSIQNSDKTSDAVLRLSSIMRYVVADASRELVPLETEINYLKDFIYLQEIRLSSAMQLDFKIEGNLINKYIAPMIFISFVENAFKYGVSTGKTAQIKIHVQVEGKKLRAQIENAIIRKDETIKEHTGIGQKNTIQRLDLLYTGKYILDIRSDEHFYSVHLTLELS